MRLEAVKKTDAGLFIDSPDRPVGAYWVKLPGIEDMVPATYQAYDATEDVDDALITEAMDDQPIFGYGWCLDQDPENEWRLIAESEFEFIGCRIPTQEALVGMMEFAQRAGMLMDAIL